MAFPTDLGPNYLHSLHPISTNAKNVVMSWQEISHLLDMKKNLGKKEYFVFCHKNDFYFSWQEQVNSSWHLYIQEKNNYDLSKKGHFRTPEVDLISDCAGRLVYGNQRVENSESNLGSMLSKQQYDLIFALQKALEA